MNAIKGIIRPQGARCRAPYELIALYRGIENNAPKGPLGKGHRCAAYARQSAAFPIGRAYCASHDDPRRCPVDTRQIKASQNKHDGTPRCPHAESECIPCVMPQKEWAKGPTHVALHMQGHETSRNVHVEELIACNVSKHTIFNERRVAVEISNGVHYTSSRARVPTVRCFTCSITFVTSVNPLAGAKLLSNGHHRAT